MQHLELTETITAGIEHLKSWLTKNGYSDIVVDFWQAGSADISADGNPGNILVQVKAAKQSEAKVFLNGTDKFALKETAAKLQRTPYIAYITIDENKDLAGEIIWERLA